MVLPSRAIAELVDSAGAQSSAAICIDAPMYVEDHLQFIALATAWLLLAAVAR